MSERARSQPGCIGLEPEQYRLEVAARLGGDHLAWQRSIAASQNINSQAGSDDEEIGLLVAFTGGGITGRNLHAA